MMQNEFEKLLDENTKKKKKFLVDSETCNLSGQGNLLNCSIKKGNVYENMIGLLNKLSHQQLAKILDMPYNYYSKLLKENAYNLLHQNIDYLLLTNKKKILLRFYNAQVGYDIRAILSKDYKIIDNENIYYCIMNTFPDLQVRELNISDNKMVLKFSFPDQIRKVHKDHDIVNGFCVTNSEVGLGGIQIYPYLFSQYYGVGKIFPWKGFSKFIHKGKPIEKFEDNMIYTEIEKAVRRVENHFTAIIINMKIFHINNEGSWNLIWTELKKAPINDDGFEERFKIEKETGNNLLGMYF